MFKWLKDASKLYYSAKLGVSPIDLHIISQLRKICEHEYDENLSNPPKCGHLIETPFVERDKK